MSRLPLFTIRQPDGLMVTGCIQGFGGVIRHRSKIEHAIRRADAGARVISVFQPEPGYCLMLPEFSAQSDGPGIRVPLAGSTLVDCADCADTGVREHNSRRVICWCEAGDSAVRS